ncbi:Type III site-specific deoxyribonuclease [Rhodanobacter thiooxydans]|uniref:Type III site-specific deoxyribonuclease n=1 Tax=Rhodanobacter thiooxydans TaxID=416169 RepID=A0A154QIF5_9GAMM|nr:DEAD/DEAH box helicase family protein [Rhodanobacter thiooxydans]KZC23909.1 Type III site-specific deoxyribonuclease [Rhodanobacter thiooxydans]
MKFRFDDQPHQAQAIESVVDLFEGGALVPSQGVVGQAPGAAGHAGFQLDRGVLARNLLAVTTRQAVEAQDTLILMEETDLLEQPRDFPNFSVEMETGTGKTYAYIATALRLAEAYGLRKFVILVHTVAIRAGVVKTFEQTREHFRAKYPHLDYQWHVLGDSQAVPDFADPSSSVQFLVAGISSLDKPATNTLYASPEQANLWNGGATGIAQLAQLRPVLLIDEPQNMATPKRRKTIATLNPLVALRYSATHRDLYNLVHRLSAKRAAELGLVKRVSVKGVVAGASGQPYLHLKRIQPRTQRGTTRWLAELVVDVAGGDRQMLVLVPGADLQDESGGLAQYQGYVIESMTRSELRFENGVTLAIGQTMGVDSLSVWRDQVRHTIRAHLQKQADVERRDLDLKVLSLFFVERVADYISDTATLPVMFDALFREEWVRSGRLAEDMPDPATLRVHYFPSTKIGVCKDTSGKANEEAFEVRAYDEIIANKEKLLDLANPRAFIFSHSALREGWDNPNVFQIGFLRHTRSDTERRQQIGRGLRLPVNQDGNRVQDEAINRLTLVVDESFSEFRDGLNAEYGGAGERPDVENEDHSVTIRLRPEKFQSPEFEALWRRIRYRAVYRIERVDEAALAAAVAGHEHLDGLRNIQRRANVVQSADLVYDDRGRVVTTDETIAETSGERVVLVGQQLPNVVQLVEDQLLHGKFPLQLTRPTVVAILSAIPARYWAGAIHDSGYWARIVAHVIRTAVIEQMVENIEYVPVDEARWWDANVVFLDSETKNKPLAVPGRPAPASGVAEAPIDGVNLYDYVDYDSWWKNPLPSCWKTIEAWSSFSPSYRAASA